MADRIIAQADLSGIWNCLRELGEYIDTTNSNVITVGKNVDALQQDLDALTADFHDFVQAHRLSARAQLAETRLVKLRQELEQKYGHYAEIRRTTKGILQANDLAIVRQETVRTAGEELMLRAPEYWLAPALVALSAWISDHEEIAVRALREALRRDEEKTALFFALVCRRAGRCAPALRWAQHYLMRQDETALDRKAILIVDAYASGLLGVDTEGLIAQQLDAWLARLSEQPGFVEAQESRWKEALAVMQPESPAAFHYPYLEEHSPTVADLKSTLAGAELHGKFYAHVQELDRVLTRLVTDFDAAEQPLREAVTFEQLVADEGGDETRAKKEMQLKQEAFEERRDFMQLLTDAAMNPKEAQASIATQKMALAISKDWMLSAYRNHIAENRAAVPHSIALRIGEFTGETENGENEEELLRQFAAWNDAMRDRELAKLRLTGKQELCRWAGIVPIVLGFYLGGAIGLVIGAVIGVLIYLSYRSAKRALETQREELQQHFAEQGKTGAEIVRGLLAEVVDYREAYRALDADSKKTLDYLTSLDVSAFRTVREGGRRMQI